MMLSVEAEKRPPHSLLLLFIAGSEVMVNGIEYIQILWLSLREPKI